MWVLIHQDTITGDPKPMGRPRFGKGRAYMPKSTIDARDHVQHSLTRTLPDLDIVLEGPIALELAFIHSRPKRLQAKRHSDGRILKTTRPDIDNLIKLVLDALQLTDIIEDDKQIVRICATDYYAARHEQPHTHYQIYSYFDSEYSNPLLPPPHEDPTNPKSI